MFRQFSGASRFAYNTCLAYKIKKYRKEGVSLGIQDLIEYFRTFRQSEDYLWLSRVPEAITKQAIKDLDKAYKGFFKRGNKGFPKFKKKFRCKSSFYQRTDKFRMVDSTHIKITGVKDPVRIRKHNKIDKVINPRVSYDGKYWYLSFSFEYEEPLPRTEGEVIGIDLGIKSLAVLSNGVVYKNINKSKTVRKLIKRKKQLQRRLSKKYLIFNKGSKGYQKSNNILKLEEKIRLLDRKLRNIRNTYLHTVTMSIVKTKPYKIVIEDLDVSSMLKNKYLSESISRQGFYTFRQYLAYKCLAYGSTLVVADKWFPSSKQCSCCGSVKKFLSLSERIYTCNDCGSSLDRDLNAAINLKNYTFSH